MKLVTSNAHYSIALHGFNFPEGTMLHEFRVDKSLVKINNLIDLAVPDQGTKRTKVEGEA